MITSNGLYGKKKTALGPGNRLTVTDLTSVSVPNTATCWAVVMGRTLFVGLVQREVLYGRIDGVMKM